jgi:hypothetical protein
MALDQGVKGARIAFDFPAQLFIRGLRRHRSRPNHEYARRIRSDTNARGRCTRLLAVGPMLPFPEHLTKPGALAFTSPGKARESSHIWRL